MVKKRDILVYCILLSIILILGACASDNSHAQTNLDGSNEVINAVTTIAQIGEPLSVVAGEYIEVETLMGPSINPHLYSPSQSDMS